MSTTMMVKTRHIRGGRNGNRLNNNIEEFCLVGEVGAVSSPRNRKDRQTWILSKVAMHQTIELRLPLVSGVGIAVP